MQLLIFAAVLTSIFYLIGKRRSSLVLEVGARFYMDIVHMNEHFC